MVHPEFLKFILEDPNITSAATALLMNDHFSHIKEIDCMIQK